MIRRNMYLRFALIFAAAASSRGSERPADESAIKAQIAGYAAARQTGDAHAQAMFYAEDADEWGSGERTMRKGRAEIEPILGEKPDPTRKFRLEVVSLSFLDKDAAIVDAFYYGKEPEPNGHAIYVMVKRKGQWLIRANRTTRMPPTKPEASVKQ